ncbi:N-acetyltransferase [Micromonospora sp. NPDC126480]|uniref:N-acetyltransferase n=1 Tax=Micromonospora sp. NPDC126480 TaxID=3155312 RepID=UPI0033258BE1
MTPIDAIVRRASGEDTAVLVPVVADALMAGGLGVWLVPDAADRDEVLCRYARFVLKRGLAHGRVDTTVDRSAVAVWYAPLRPPPPSSVLWRYELHRLLGPYAPRFALLHAYRDAAHPHTPHHYLAQVAARPGRDAAAAVLLDSHHRVLDGGGLAAYAEVCGDRPREGLLARLGYVPRSPILLEPGGPALWRMWRPAAGGGYLDSLPRRIRLGPAVTPRASRVMPVSPRSP